MRKKDKIEVIPVETLSEVIEHVLTGPGKEELLAKLKSLKPPRVSGKVEPETEKNIVSSQDSIHTPKRNPTNQ